MRIAIATTITAAAAAAVLLAASVQAQPQPQPSLYPIKCDNAITQTDMTLCANQDYKKSDADLNDAYRTLIKRFKGDSTKTTQLQSAQKAWLFFRDAECAFSASGASGGSIYPMVLSQCLDTLTQARTKDLRGYLTCKEGDTGCPVPREE